MDTQESVQTEEVIDRKDMLAQQFEEAETAPVNEDEPREAPKEQEPEAKAEDSEPTDEEPVWKRAPSSWKRDYHEAWATADPKLQQYAWQREEEMRSGIAPMQEKAKFADQIQQAIAPYEQTIRGLGIDTPTAVKSLLEADNILRSAPPEQKRAYLAQLAQQYGIDLSGVESQYPSAPIDPTVFALQNELNNIRGEVVGWKQQQEAAQNQILLNEIDDFAQKAEHFEAVRPLMIGLLNSGVANTLDEAYNKALRLDDNLFEQDQKGRQAQAEAAKREAADKAAKNAKAAAVSVKSSTPGVRTATKAQDRRSLLLEQLDNMSERF